MHENILNAKRLGFLLAVGAAGFWALAIVLSKAALGGMQASQLFFIQVVAAAAVAWAVVLVRGEKFGLNKKSLLAYSTGLLEPFLAYLLSLYGLALISAGAASVIYSAETILIIILACLLLKIKIASPARFVLLVLVAGLGSLMAIGDGETGGVGGINYGHGLVFAGVFFAALYVVISAKLVAEFSPPVLLAGQLSFCVLLFAVFALPFVELKSVGVATFFIAIVSGVLQYYLAFCCYLFALRFIAVHTAGACLYFIPVFSIGLAYIFLGERVGFWQVVGVLIVVASLLYLHIKYEKNVDAIEK